MAHLDDRRQRQQLRGDQLRHSQLLSHHALAQLHAALHLQHSGPLSGAWLCQDKRPALGLPVAIVGATCNWQSCRW